MEDRPPRIELPDPLQVIAYRRMTVEQRLRAGFDTSAFVRRSVWSHLAHKHPEWSDMEIKAAVAKRFLGRS